MGDHLFRIQFNYEAKVDGVYGTFTGEKKLYPGDLASLETVDNFVNFVFKIAKTKSNAEITFRDYDLGAYGDDEPSFCRIVCNMFNDKQVIRWPRAESRNYNDYEKHELNTTKKEIRAIVSEALQRWKNYVNTAEQATA